MGWDNEGFANSTVLPADGTIDLGTSAKPFDDVYADRFHGNGAAITAVDHGLTAGRSDDDHTQYHTDARGDIRYNTKAQITTISGDIVNQIPTSYISDAEMTTISGDIVGQIPSLAAYATDAEVATISGDIVAQLTFLNLTDTPNSYTDQSNKYVMVSGTGLVFATVSGGAGTDHATLANLTYAAAGHTGFLSSAQFATSSGDITAQIPSLAGYLTTAAFTTSSGDIVNQIPSDYVSDSEMTTISGDIVAQIPTTAIFATDAEVNVISGAIVAQIPANFDSRYYTEGEVDVISGAINAKITGYTGSVPTVSGALTVANGLITAYTPA